MAFRGITSKMVTFTGFGGTTCDGYYAAPNDAGPHPGVVVIHHMPGWDEWTTEVVYKFALHGYAAVAPNLYSRVGDGAKAEVVEAVRAAGGPGDDQMLGDVSACAELLRAQPGASGKVATIGFCSGGRQSYLAACKLKNIDAAIDCWGGRVVIDGPSGLTPTQPVAPIEYTAGISVPLLGLFGNEDKMPSPAHVDATEAELKRLGKTYEFHRYDGAGHAFFAVYRPQYRVEQAIDGWNKVFDFLHRKIGGPVS